MSATPARLIAYRFFAAFFLAAFFAFFAILPPNRRCRASGRSNQALLRVA
jgi:hypothetical protein